MGCQTVVPHGTEVSRCRCYRIGEAYATNKHVLRVGWLSMSMCKTQLHVIQRHYGNGPYRQRRNNQYPAATSNHPPERSARNDPDALSLPLKGTESCLNYDVSWQGARPTTNHKRNASTVVGRKIFRLLAHVLIILPNNRIVYTQQHVVLRRGMSIAACCNRPTRRSTTFGRNRRLGDSKSS